MRLILLTLALLALALAPARADVPVLKIAVLKFGTVNWLTETLTRNGYDDAAGYELQAVELAGRPAANIAFQAGEVDLIVADWVWALGQRGRGHDIRFVPYSVSLGALMAREGVVSVCDLEGRKVGVVGGPEDKSWLVLQTLARQDCGFDLAAGTEAIFGAPPLMARQLEDGEIDAVSTYWHWAARLEAKGFERVIDVTDAMAVIGIAPAPPLIGFVWDAGRTDPSLMGRFARSLALAQEKLATDDAEWEGMRGRMNADSDDEFRLLRDRFRAGITGPWTAAETASAERLHALMAGAGGKLTAEAGTFDPALFEAPPADGG